MHKNLFLKCVIQRVKNADLSINGISQGKLDGSGLVIFFGVGFKNTPTQIIESELPKLMHEFSPINDKLVDKILNLRIFSDENGKMNLSVKDISGGIYVVSQFTLFADCKKGNRPGFTSSATPFVAKNIYEQFLLTLKNKSATCEILNGTFAADMQVSLCNDGPVTLILNIDSNGFFD